MFLYRSLALSFNTLDWRMHKDFGESSWVQIPVGRVELVVCYQMRMVVPGVMLCTAMRGSPESWLRHIT